MNSDVTFLDAEDTLFGDDTEETVEKPDTPPENKDPEEGKKPGEKDDEPAEDFGEDDEPFGDEDDDQEDDEDPDNPESVGGKKHTKDGKKVVTEGDDATSPNVFSSFAEALLGDNIFQFLDEETIKSVKDSDSFAEAMNKEIEARLDDVQKRVNDALNAGVGVDEIRQYENIITRLEGLTDEQLTAETPEGAKLRQNILYQDCLNRGYTEDKAKKIVQRAVKDGTDLEDAKDALESNIQFFKDKYDGLIQEKKDAAEQERKKTRKEAEEFRKAVLEKEKVFGDIEVDKATRQKAYAAMTKIVGKNEDGEPVTAVQKFADENPVEFRTILGIVWALTNEFKSLGNVVQKDVNKKVRSNLKAIEDRIKGSGSQGGSPRFAGGSEEDNSYRGNSQGWHF